ncbi:putative F-box domain-containing protein [Helianthus annuus]|uniref:F-box domain-containing protein n=1 Tax=Helianthus annuus TaxID=4232 RepID=A0A251T7Z2_HELAN|nr:F-box protein At2g32560 isoform X1 [Helianthus annuus]KAF5779031.1 putative F-box domain-containing protein [Helianthus annuus]KAJ0490362.1 putative F-box domain-containing protein [Helianthus annuus]KAJ0494542.1 putative F-box domain-containing protein [Helianthus annuus]KAJ0506280.1 putative F-box domain-containing protein [Helianthus annuus]KAJ0675952.1 putative F-box domain-containing protein [Helianthus annuus]
MLIYFVTFVSFIFFYKYSLPIKQLPPWSNETRLLSLQFLEDLSILFPSVKSLKNALSVYFNTKMASSKAKRKCYSKLNTNTMENVETTTTAESSSLLDLPDLALETILEKLEPVDLCKMACVSSQLRDMCSSEYLWKQHMKRKWGRVFGFVAKKEWLLHVASQKNILDGAERRGFLSKLWPVMLFKSSDERKSSQPRDTCSAVSCYRALETGRFWFPAQVFNRENGHVGFVMSSYDAELSYDSQTDTFEARYPPHGQRAESGVTWDRLREVPVDNSPHDLHISTCLNDLRPKDHIEIQWRRNKHYPYGWWYGVIGHLESCDANNTYCRCHESDMVVLEFKQYAPGSRWRRMTLNRKEHREEGTETEGFYGGIKKLCNKDEITMWQRFWPNDILE